MRLVIPGAPHGKSRPRFAHGRAYTDPKAAGFKERTIIAWNQTDGERLDGPLSMTVTICRPRPTTHFRKTGLLSRQGENAPCRPTTTPDLDNAAGSIMDALNGLAYGDDRQIVRLVVDRVWVVGDPVVTCDLERFVA